MTYKIFKIVSNNTELYGIVARCGRKQVSRPLTNTERMTYGAYKVLEFDDVRQELICETADMYEHRELVKEQYKKCREYNKECLKKSSTKI